MMRLVYRIIYICFLLQIGGVFAVLSLLRLGILLIKSGPRKMFGVTKRDTEPKCLTDSCLGTHGYLHLEDIRIHYVSKGSTEKPLMLFLHGFPESWYSWRHQIKEFATDYRVVAVDTRGYGDSSKPSGISQYKLECMVKDVKQIITALGYSSCVLVGHDWGGAISWAFSGCYPEMVDRTIILNCPHPHAFKKYMQSHWAQFKKSWYMFFFLLPILPEIYIGLSDLKFFEIIFKGKKGGVQTNSTTAKDVEAYKFLFKTYGSRTGPINYIRAGLTLPVPSRLSQKVTKPVLLIWGCKDMALETGLAETCKDFAYDLSIKYIKEASHWVQMDHPEEVNSYIHEFLGENFLQN